MINLLDTPLNEIERSNAEKWMAKHQTTCAHANFDTDAIVGGYGYKMKILCLTCGMREDVTDNLEHGGYPHK